MHILVPSSLELLLDRATKGGERETHQWAAALRLTPALLMVVTLSNRLGAAALNRDHPICSSLLGRLLKSFDVSC